MKSLLVFCCLCILFLVSSVSHVALAQYGGGRNMQGLSHTERILQHAKAAARYKNMGRMKEANTEVESAEAAFAEAIAEDPNDIQAYANVAIFQSNIAKFTQSFQNFKKALKIAKGDPGVTKQLQEAYNRAKLGYYSMKRDKVYNNGKGNLTAAYQWGLRQLKVGAKQLLQHQVATMEVMLCERNASMCESAQQRFKTAAELSAEKFIEDVEAARINDIDNFGEENCEERGYLLSGEWSQHRDVKSTEVAPGLFLHVTTKHVVGRGSDGVLAVIRSADCRALLPSSDCYMNLADNLLGQHGQHVRGHFDKKGPVLSLVQFAGQAFYHWMAEAIPRLAIAMKTLKAFSQEQNTGTDVPMPLPWIVVPAMGRDRTIPKFINATFTSLFKSSWGDIDWEERIIPYTPGVIFERGVAFVGWETQPCPPLGPLLSEDEQKASDERIGCSSLTHPGALQEARTAIHEALDPQTDPEDLEKLIGAETTAPGPYVLIAMRGSSVTMRSYDEEALFSSVEPLVTKSGFALRKFDAAKYSLVEALTLFRGASAIIGVHGGALANLVSAREGAAVVEIGFKTAAARHYHHMSTALGLRYHFVPIDLDPKDRALGADSITFDLQRVLSTVEQALQSLKDSKGSIQFELS